MPPERPLTPPTTDIQNGDVRFPDIDVRCHGAKHTKFEVAFQRITEKRTQAHALESLPLTLTQKRRNDFFPFFVQQR